MIRRAFLFLELAKRSLRVIAVCSALVTSTWLVAQEAEDVLVNDPRPLAAAIRQFAKRCHCMVMYEDVKWVRNQVEESPILRKRPDGTPALIPRGTPFTFTVPRHLSEMEPPAIAQSLRLVMRRFEASRNPGQFRIVKGHTSLHVLPAHAPLLETRISVAANDISAHAAVRAALGELGRVSGEKIDMWRSPLNLMKRPVSVTMSDEPAYEVFTRVLAAVDGRLSAELLYDVNAKSYFLTVYLGHGF